MPHNLKLKKIRVEKDKMPMMNESPAMFPPSFSADDMQIPEIKHWEVGKKYYLTIQIEQKSKNESEDNRVSGRFDIIAYKHLKEKPIDEMDDKEFGELQGEELARAGT